MIIRNVNVFRTCIGPFEPDASFVVYADAVLPIAITRQFLKPVARRHRKHSNVAAVSSCVSFRVATLTIAAERIDLPVSKRFRVSGHLKPVITRSHAVTLNVKHQSTTDFDLLRNN